MIKKFVIAVGEALINIVTFLCLFFFAALAFWGIYDMGTHGEEQAVLTVIYAIVGVLFVVVANFLIYLAIDIKDQLKSINKKLSNDDKKD